MAAPVTGIVINLYPADSGRYTSEGYALAFGATAVLQTASCSDFFTGCKDKRDRVLAHTFLCFTALFRTTPFRFQVIPAYPADPDIHARYLAGKRTLHIPDIHVEACRLHALKRAAVPALEMGMGWVPLSG